MLFRDAAAEYMADKRKRLRASTLEGYRSALELHVLPRWAGVELDAITPEDVQAWVDGFELAGAAEKAYKTLRQVIRWAIRRLGVRMYDPTAAGVELPRKGRSGWLCDLTPDTVARRIRSACRRAGAAWTSMTECRHTWATLAVEAGVGIETVALMLGHTGISTAYEHYIVPRARVCKDAQREVERLIMRA